MCHSLGNAFIVAGESGSGKTTVTTETGSRRFMSADDSYWSRLSRHCLLPQCNSQPRSCLIIMCERSLFFLTCNKRLLACSLSRRTVLYTRVSVGVSIHCSDKCWRYFLTHHSRTHSNGISCWASVVSLNPSSQSLSAAHFFAFAQEQLLRSMSFSQPFMTLPILQCIYDPNQPPCF